MVKRTIYKVATNYDIPVQAKDDRFLVDDQTSGSDQFLTDRGKLGFPVIVFGRLFECPLELSVAALLLDGWVLHGSPSISRGRIIQALTKEVDCDEQ